MLSRATQIPDKTSKSFIVGSCVVGSLRYKCQFAWFIPGVAGRGTKDCGQYGEAAGAAALKRYNLRQTAAVPVGSAVEHCEGILFRACSWL